MKKAAELTESERKWVEELERVLLRCPPRLSLLTIGDRWLAVLDERIAQTIDLHDGKYAPADVATVYSKCKIHGVSG